MPIIEKIEIKNFRSFGNKTKETVQISKISNLNIFSGANDSGKSNILRALNLFFNGKVGLDSGLIFDRDFHKKSEIQDNDVKQELITIKIWFHNENNKGKNRDSNSRYLPERFWVSKKWIKSGILSEGSSIETDFKKEKNLDKDADLPTETKASLQKQLTDFINSIQFQYVPAIKDKTYFSYLYGELQKTLRKIENSKIEKTQKAFEHEIQEETSKLMEEFKTVISQNVSLNETIPFFQMPSNLVDFFKTLKVNTGDIDLDLRGDGIQAKLIPEILYFIAQKEKSYKQNKLRKGEKSKKYFIWGFEEPENSYEYKNAQLLADRFSTIFSNIAQIFITTHSFSFISLSGDTISKYRVYKDIDSNSSKILKVRDTEEGLFKFDALNIVDDDLVSELGIYELSKELKGIYDKKNAELENLQKIKQSIEQSVNILFVEDKYTELYKISWLKLNNIEFSEQNFRKLFDDNANFKIIGVEGCSKLKLKINQENISEFKGKKVVSVFDFDKSFNDFNGLQKKYWGEIEGEESTCLYRKRDRISKFYALLIPVPGFLATQASKSWGGESKVEVELLFSDSKKQYLKKCFEMKTIPGGGNIIVFKNSAKKNFWKKLINLDKKDFKNIKPLFDFIKNIFNN